MQSDREGRAAQRNDADAAGVVIRATRRGSLVLETENARRMARRLGRVRPAIVKREADAAASSQQLAR